MAKVTFATDIQSISGKLCKKEGVIYSVNSRTGKAYRSDRHGYNDANTAEQQTNRAEFKQKSQLASQWWKENKPKTKDDKGTEAYQAVIKAYKAQFKIGNPFSYLRTLVTDDHKVILGGKDLTSGVSLPTDDGQGDTPTPGGEGSMDRPFE